MSFFHKLNFLLEDTFYNTTNGNGGEGEGFSMSFGPHFKRFNNSLRRGSKRFYIKRNRPFSITSNPDFNQNETVDSSQSKDEHLNSINNGQPQAWAASFEKLLEDSKGVKAFSEFLKKEFSSENIDFWISVERFRLLNDGPDKKTEARRIYQQHVCVGAPEAVNVDAQGRQCAEQALQDAPSNMFDQAQKQVFNLMKFDSYPRFLKSELYKQSLEGCKQMNATSPTKLKKSLSNAEDRRRKSLLPWHRKSRSKSKDRENDEIDSLNLKKEIHSSRSSLTSLDMAMNNSTHDESFTGVLCRVVLENSTSVVQIKPTETVQELVQRLLEKRVLSYNSFEVYSDRHSKPVDINEVSSVLAGCEVRVQQRVVFKLDLPNRKTVSVKSKATKMIVDVLKPILHKYDFSVEQVVLINPKFGGEIIDINQSITVIDGLKLQVQLIDKRSNSLPESRLLSSSFKTNKLIEITNQVFEGILHEKTKEDNVKSKSEKGSVKSDDGGSEHSSSYFGKFMRKDSTQQEWKKRSLIPRSKLLSNATAKIVSTPDQKNKPLIAKWKTGVNKLQISPNSESVNELVEGLTRAQKSRLEDQRGTEINFELPDFLKDKESDETVAKNTKTLYENQDITTTMENNDSSPVNTPNKQMKLQVRNSSQSLSPFKEKIATVKREFKAEPPPLPPKPKIVPLRPSNWGQNDLFIAPKSIQSEQSLFLEKASSSFV